MASEARSDLINGYVLANFTHLPNIRSPGHPKWLQKLVLNFDRSGRRWNGQLLDLRSAKAPQVKIIDILYFEVKAHRRTCSQLSTFCLGIDPPLNGEGFFSQWSPWWICCWILHEQVAFHLHNVTFEDLHLSLQQRERAGIDSDAKLLREMGQVKQATL